MESQISKQAKLCPVDSREQNQVLSELIKPGQYRWAIYDRKERKLFFGPSDIHIHLTVAEMSGVLSHHPDYYRPGGNILGGFVACSKDGYYYYDPFSGTFPGTNEGVAEAEDVLCEICKTLELPFKHFENVTKKKRAIKG